MKDLARFQTFIDRFNALVDSADADEQQILNQGAPLLAELVSHDDWLPDEFAQESAESYRQYLLYGDPDQRFSVMSFVWGPGQRTPIHDHTVWGLVGVLRGAEICHEYDWPTAGMPMIEKARHHLMRGEVDKVSPTIGDVHIVENALKDRSSISIHVYGADIGTVQRHVFDPMTGAVQPFVSGYHGAMQHLVRATRPAFSSP